MDSLNYTPYLIVGLGNPGREYSENRHNVGFMALNRLADRLGLKFLRVESKALVTKGDFKGRRLILAKPQTYMNLSGQAVIPLARYYRVPSDRMLIVHDDVDLPFEMLRLRPDGGSAGQKGIQSIIDALGSQDFARLRIGIGHPHGKKAAAEYVLQNFNRSEAELLPTVLDRAVDAIITFVIEGIWAAMNRYNAREEDGPTSSA